jgi:hypothetical protein
VELTFIKASELRKKAEEEGVEQVFLNRTTNETFISLIVSNSVIELENGTVVRDYLEVMSKDTKAIYDDVMEKM